MFILINILMLSWIKIVTGLTFSYLVYFCNQYSYYEIYQEYSKIT